MTFARLVRSLANGVAALFGYLLLLAVGILIRQGIRVPQPGTSAIELLLIDISQFLAWSPVGLLLAGVAFWWSWRRMPGR